MVIGEDGHSENMVVASFIGWLVPSRRSMAITFGRLVFKSTVGAVGCWSKQGPGSPHGKLVRGFRIVLTLKSSN